MADREGNRGADDEHMDGELADEKTCGEFALWRARERDGDERHKQMDQDAVENSIEDWPRDKKR
jgi:hypothetical protein